jgi:hypothetical protein
MDSLVTVILGSTIVFADCGGAYWFDSTRHPWNCCGVHQQDDIRLAVLEIALLALLVPNFSRLELVTYIVIDSLVLGLELEKN